MNYLLTHDPLDALSFCVYDAGCILANDITRWPFRKTDIGQTLLFHEFMQSWVGFELVKVLVRGSAIKIVKKKICSKCHF